MTEAPSLPPSQYSQETSQPAAVMTFISIPPVLGLLTGDIAAGSGYDESASLLLNTTLTGDIAAGSGYDKQIHE